MAAITVGDEKKGRETDFTVSVGDGSRSPRGEIQSSNSFDCDCLAGRINGKLRKCPRIAVCADWGIKALDSTEPVMYLQ